MRDIWNQIEKKNQMIEQLHHPKSKIALASKIKNTSLTMLETPCLMTSKKKVEEKGMCKKNFCMVGNRFSLNMVSNFLAKSKKMEKRKRREGKS